MAILEAIWNFVKAAELDACRSTKFVGIFARLSTTLKG